MTEKKKDVLKNVLINIGIMLVLIGSTAVKGENLAFFLLGLGLLAIQTFEIKADPGKLVMAEIMLSAALAVGAVTQLVMSKSFGTPQVFMVILLLGGILIIVESLRKYADL